MKSMIDRENFYFVYGDCWAYDSYEDATNHESINYLRFNSVEHLQTMAENLKEEISGYVVRFLKHERGSDFQSFVNCAITSFPSDSQYSRKAKCEFVIQTDIPAEDKATVEKLAEKTNEYLELFGYTSKPILRDNIICTGEIDLKSTIIKCPRPDKTVTLKNMDEYGFTYRGFIPLSPDGARKLKLNTPLDILKIGRHGEFCSYCGDFSEFSHNRTADVDDRLMNMPDAKTCLFGVLIPQWFDYVKNCKIVETNPVTYDFKRKKRCNEKITAKPGAPKR